MINGIVTYINIEIERKKQKFSEECKYVGSTNYVELCALFGLLYFYGNRKDSHLNVKEMWSVYGPDIY